MRRLVVALFVLCVLDVPVHTQRVSQDSGNLQALPAHVIVDSCAGCGGPVTLPEVTTEAGSSLSAALTIQGTAAGVPVPVTFGALGVDINDGDGDHIAITSFAPTTENGLVVRNIPSGTQHIVCDSGCGSPPATADNSAFTFGTTSVSPIGAVVDDTSTNTVTENSFGAPRMSTNRVLYVDLKQTQANTTAIKVDGSAVTQPVSGTFWQATQPVSGTFWQATQPVSGTFWQATQPVSGTVTTTPPANASTNVAQLAGTTTDTNSGSKSAGTLRVVLATDQPALTNKLLVTPDSVALPANQSVNVNQLAGTTTDTNSGVKSAGTLRVVLATDQPQLTNKLLVTPDANSAVNVAQFGGTNVVTGTGAGGSGIPRVTVSNDSAVKLWDGTNTTTVKAASTAAAFTDVAATVDVRPGGVFPASAAAADGASNPTSTTVVVDNQLYNGSTWDRMHGNWRTTTGDTGAKTVTFNGATQTNYEARGAFIVVQLGTVSGTTPTLTVQLQVSYDAGTNFLNVGPASGTATATNNTIAVFIYPANLSQTPGSAPAVLTTGATQTLALNMPLPRTWRFVYTIGGTTPSFAITAVHVSYAQ